MACNTKLQPTPEASYALRPRLLATLTTVRKQRAERPCTLDCGGLVRLEHAFAIVMLVEIVFLHIGHQLTPISPALRCVMGGASARPTSARATALLLVWTQSDPVAGAQRL